MRSVLIVEDNDDLRLIYTRVFRKANFDVRLACDGIEGIAALVKHLPDVVIMDVNMPRMTGLEVLAHIRREATMRMVKVIMVSSNAVAMGTPEGELADLFLQKPISVHELITMTRRLLGDTGNLEAPSDPPAQPIATTNASA
ncbi:MAG TPA: response regulator [Aggregatilineales bacterium]|nr:response regulator [Anaerolineales bacterium]HRE47596.1 response regulator [Aggregatilineales bacterium]